MIPPHILIEIEWSARSAWVWRTSVVDRDSGARQVVAVGEGITLDDVVGDIYKRGLVQ